MTEIMLPGRLCLAISVSPVTLSLLENSLQVKKKQGIVIQYTATFYIFIFVFEYLKSIN